ncbi:transcriptional regulator, LysR family [Pseudofrankia inefficax]|uniref:Transcriptional regulator, LysR family n=1 Tax=Pseudofrankia inefficax (strain DSM 45817 / CECT 9037 / DDB 130130 / EuI1c) TaxID=298654 RepID=E3JB24_PSEI1|nr:transcriptional regulator, LysR family [Pseudofrankia inefficax]
MTRLRVLVAVARHGSVTAAARALQYAQPSVSHHLSRLEAETGSQLIQRVGRGVRLTEAGQVLAERAEEILGRLDAAEAELATYTGLRAGRVRLAAFPSALGTFVPTAAAAFAAASPGIELRLTEAEPPDAIRLLRSGEVDVALIFAYRDQPSEGNKPRDAQPANPTVTAAAPSQPRDEPADDGLRRVTLLTEPIYLVTPLNLPGDRLVDHSSKRWIAGCERCRTALIQSCTAVGFTPDIAFTTDDYLAVQALVAAGLGVTTLPDLSLRSHRHPGVRATEIPGLARTVTAAVHGEPPDPPATAALLAHLATAARAWTPEPSGCAAIEDRR